MTIEGNHENLTSGGANATSSSNPPPFSPHVDMGAMPASLAQPTSDATALPTLADLQQLVKDKKIKEAKALVRTTNWQAGSVERVNMWKELCRRHTNDDFSDLFYWDTLQQIYGTKDVSECHVVLPAFVDQHHKVHRALTPDGTAACERVISVVAYYYPAITYAPILYPLTAVLLHYMNEPDVYNCISALVCSNKTTFITQTKVAYEATWRATLVLARKHVRGSFSVLEKYGITPAQIDEAFHDWLWWIFNGLPIPHLVRVVDCFLMEGSKVLLRIALALFHLFIKAVTRDANVGATLSTRGLLDAIMKYCQSLQVSPAKLLKTAFGIRAFSKTEIGKVLSKTEMLLKSRPSLTDACGGHVNTHAGSLTRSLSHEGLPTSHAQADVQMLSHTLNVKELLTIWNWLPMRMTMQQPSLLYTTEEHGSSLTTFYQRVEKYEPTILLVRTTCDHTFGAYCSAAWEERNKRDEYGNRQTYFGTGETFLFSLRPKAVKYQWVGITRQQKDSELSHVEHSSELFMHADNYMITVGGGNGQGLMLDHELRFGKTEHCETFDNPQLCPTPDFEIKVVEVYGLGISQDT